MLLAVSISSYGCTWEVWRTLKKLKFLSAARDYLKCLVVIPRKDSIKTLHAPHKNVINMYF